MARHLLAVAALFAALGFGQESEKTFYFTHPASADEMQATARTMTIITELRGVLPDPERKSLVVHGPPDKLVAAEWLFHQLEQPPATAEYKLGGPREEVLSLFRISPAASSADLTQLVTAVRITADLSQVFPLEGRNTIIARGPAPAIAAAGWLVRQLAPYDGAPPTVDSPPYPVEPAYGMGPETIRIFRMAPDSTRESRGALMVAIRVVTAMQRIDPLDSERAVILRGPSDRMAIAEWMIEKLGRPSATQAKQQATMAVADGLIRIFYFTPPRAQSDLQALAAQIRTATGMQRVFPSEPHSAMVVRGQADQVQAAEGLIAKF